MTTAITSLLRYQPVRYVLNGLVATCISYAVLNVCLRLTHISSAGAANFIAAVVGITTSFLGNRYFVFPGTTEPIWHQLARFWLLYAILALMQAAVLFVWTDMAKLNYSLGFLIGTFMQMVCSYFGGKHWVFKR